MERVLTGAERQMYGDKATLVGIGYFQTVSTRNAGLQLIDLRKCNQARRALIVARGATAPRAQSPSPLPATPPPPRPARY